MEMVHAEYSHCLKQEGKVYTKAFDEKQHAKIREMSLKINYLLNICLIREQPSSLVAQKYEIVDQIAQSTFSNVFLVRELQTQKLCCMKKIKNDKEYFD